MLEVHLRLRLLLTLERDERYLFGVYMRDLGYSIIGSCLLSQEAVDMRTIHIEMENVLQSHNSVEGSTIPHAPPVVPDVFNSATEVSCCD